MNANDDIPGLAGSWHESIDYGFSERRPANALEQLPEDLLPVLKTLCISDDLLGVLADIEAADSVDQLCGAQCSAFAFALAAWRYGDLSATQRAALDQYVAQRVARRKAVLQEFPL